MTSCTILLMIWLAKFDNANPELGSYGWFISSQEEPIKAWFSFDKDTKRRFGDFIDYKEGMTNYFTVSTYRYLVDKDDILIQQGVCKLDGKRYKYQEIILDGKIK